MYVKIYHIHWTHIVNNSLTRQLVILLKTDTKMSRMYLYEYAHVLMYPYVFIYINVWIIKNRHDRKL